MPSLDMTAHSGFSKPFGGSKDLRRSPNVVWTSTGPPKPRGQHLFELLFFFGGGEGGNGVGKWKWSWRKARGSSVKVRVERFEYLGPVVRENGARCSW